MTETIQDLTVENVKYWYHELDPPWSAIDIANHLGCNSNTVYRFMHRNNIAVRSRSEANTKRFECPFKYKDFLKQRRSEEFRDSQAEATRKVMKDPEVRQKRLVAFQHNSENVLSEYQKIIVALLFKHKRLFLTDFVQITHLDRIVLDRSLHGLYKRKLVRRIKKYNKDTNNSYKSHFNYSLTTKGRKVFKFNMAKDSFDFKKILRYVKTHPIRKSSGLKNTKNYIYMGHIQKQILEMIKEKGSLFFTDLKALSNGKRTIDNSLRNLVKRGFLNRKRQMNPNANNNLHYLYSLTDKGKKYFSQQN
ncbi:MAG: hypothetical protein ACFFDF_23015 [Candidatus Odinarchaeota archaeon]